MKPIKQSSARLLFYQTVCCLILFQCQPSSVHPPETPPPPDLPNNVYFRTKTESFNRRYYLALRNGLIWFKENTEITGIQGSWRLIGKTGKPDKNFHRFGKPAKITEISADGIHLMALAESSVFYRGTNLTNNVTNTFNWDDRWGFWGAKGPGLKNEVKGRAWSVSDAFPFHLKYYEDSNGQKHGIGLGVAHLYYLSSDGKKIYYNDWWLPADWSRQFACPNRGTFEAINLSASGSTIFIIGKNGQLYTRMYDFDISGENPLLTYSYIKTGTSGTTRKLPMPGWQLEPTIQEGKITAKITIFQNGTGNAARVLRVEGEREGKTGFFYKNIFDKTWNFKETGLPIDLPCIDIDTAAVPETIASPFDRMLKGSLTVQKQSVPLELTFLNFNIACPPAKVVPHLNGKPIRQSDGNDLVLDFYHSHTLVTGIRKMDFWDCGQKADVWGALLIPEAIYGTLTYDQENYLRTCFHSLNVINFIGKATRESIEMDEITTSQKGPSWVPVFIVPKKEKSGKSRYHLQGAAP